MSTLKLRTPRTRLPSPGQVAVEHFWARVRRTHDQWARVRDRGHVVWNYVDGPPGPGRIDPWRGENR